MGYVKNKVFEIVMGTSEENSFRYSIDIQISFQKSPSRTPHP